MCVLVFGGRLRWSSASHNSTTLRSPSLYLRGTDVAAPQGHQLEVSPVLTPLPPPLWGRPDFSGSDLGTGSKSGRGVMPRPHRSTCRFSGGRKGLPRVSSAADRDDGHPPLAPLGRASRRQAPPSPPQGGRGRVFSPARTAAEESRRACRSGLVCEIVSRPWGEGRLVGPDLGTGGGTRPGPSSSFVSCVRGQSLRLPTIAARPSSTATH